MIRRQGHDANGVFVKKVRACGLAGGEESKGTHHTGRPFFCGGQLPRSEPTADEGNENNTEDEPSTLAHDRTP
jgi:hypothetical protein